jgi:hypothetical protein
MPHVTGIARIEDAGRRKFMKIVVSMILVVALVCTATPPTYAEPRQVIQGTEIHLTLLSNISSSSAREGDPIVAEVSQPVKLGDQVLIPAGIRVHGIVGTIQKAKNFSAFRGQAYMSITFKTLEIDSRLVPVQMSLLDIGTPRIDSVSKVRKDVKITEGEVIQQKHDYKGDAIGMAIGGGGGSLVGLIFSNAMRGFGIGMAGGAIYVATRKGKEVKMPAQTGLLVRLESSVTVPSVAANNESAIASTR